MIRTKELSSLVGVSNVSPAWSVQRTPSNVTATIRQLVFKPTPSRVAVGLSETVAFNVRADDGYVA